MRWLVKCKNRVGLARHAPAEARILTVDPGQSEEDATALVSRVCQHIADPIWQLELTGLASMDCRLAVLLAVTLADAAETDETVALKVPEHVRLPTVLGIARALVGQRQGRWRELFLQLMAVSVGWAILCFLVMRHGGSKPTAVAEGGTGGSLFAIHAEESTRTRHAVHLAGEATAPTILLLGRPAAHIRDARRVMDPQKRLHRNARLLRPLSLGACLRGLPAGVKQGLDGAFWLWRTGVRPSLRDRLAMTYRVMQGAAHAAWWHGVTIPEQRILFGHTGTADTSLLERAMQADGSQTVHLVHGTGLGWPFAGISDVALFHSGADAQAAARLPAYGRCTHIRMAPPDPVKGDARWLLLTSYTHPLNAEYTARGPEADLSVIHWVQQAARALGQDPRQIIWRPHPMLLQTSSAARATLQNAADQAGFQPWPRDTAYEQLAEFGNVITTPSTALTDALRLGVVPILAVSAPLQSDLIYGAYPVVARDAVSLQAALCDLRDPGMRTDRFARAWQTIQPGGALSKAAIQAAGCEGFS